ncbi:hypothetical protein ABXS69_04525 [Actinomyces timonensis]|uniref:Helicase XPB/Ssl2 N-terminal domain-containing protein n=1 Tax=Actinomyces timonensis TaxID=1288391 RepID=A0AAU8N1N6_9ACTO
MIARRAEAGEFTLLPLVALDDALVLGPVVGAGYPWSLRDVLSAVHRNTDLPDTETAPAAASAPLDLMGTHAAFELFREITGVLPSQLSERVCVMDVPSLDMHLERPVVPFGTAGPRAVTAASDPKAPVAVQDDVLDSLMALMAPRTGLVSRADDLDLPQEPLFLAAFIHGWNESRRSVGHSRENLASARREALLDAVAQVAASSAGEPASVAAGVDVDDARRRAGWMEATRVLTQRIPTIGATPMLLPLPTDPLSDLLIRFMMSRGLVIRLLVWPDVSDRLVVGAATDPTGAVVGWTAQAAPTLDDAALVVLDRLTASVQEGVEEGAGGLPDGFESALRDVAEAPWGTGAIGAAQTPVTWETALGAASTSARIVDATPEGIVQITPVRAYSVAVESEGRLND